MKKALYLFLSLSIISCQTPIENTNKVDGFKKNDTPNNISGVMKKELVSTEINSQIKKNFLSIDKNSFKINGVMTSISKVGEDQALKLDKEDLKRKFILNITSNNEKFNPKELIINVNSENIVDTDIDELVNDISIPLTSLKEGDNLINSKQLSDKNLKVEIFGFIDPIDIPRAVHSKLMVDDNSKVEYVKGKVGIKFREGMKVRLNDRKLIDIDGLSLTTLERFMTKYNVKSIAHTIGKDVKEFDEDEIKAEKLFQTDVANQNLFFNLEVDKNEDIWKLVMELRQLPFIEEAFPEFISKPMYTPNDIGLTGNSKYDPPNLPYVDHNKWLKIAHIMGTSPNEFSPNRTSDVGAWDITRGNKSIKIAVLDSGSQVLSPETSYVSSTHPDLNDIQPVGNIDVNVVYTNTDLNHGTATAGVIGAKGNNSIGVAGVAYDSHVLSIHAYNGGPSKCRGQGGGTSNCDPNADSILLAKRLGARVIVLTMAAAYDQNDPLSGFTAEQSYPAIRAAVVSAVANGITVCIPAGNHHTRDITNFSGIPTPDTGSIIVGALQHDGSARMTNYNYGKSLDGGYNNYYTNGGHGVDVSASGQGLYTTFSNNSYNHFGGTSGATPTVGGVVALMLSVKSDLTPLEIRKTIRETRDKYNTDKTIMPGMVNAYKAVTRYSTGGGSSSTVAGLDAKFYANTIFPPETVLNELEANASLQENNIAYYRRGISNIDFNTGTPDSFGSGLKYSYMTNIQGFINFSQTGAYNFALLHDDGAIVKINGQEIIRQKNSSDNFSYGTYSATTVGKQSIQILRNQETGNANTVLWWSPPGSGYQVVPASAFSYSSSIATTYDGYPKSKLIGRFFKTTTLPLDPIGNMNIVTNPLVSIGSRLYDNINFPNASNQDQFGIGHADNFAGYFSGFIKLPLNYISGNYNFTVYHNDGASLYIDGQQKISATGTTSSVVGDSNIHYLQTGIYYPFVIQYYQNTSDADLRFSWTPPNMSQQIIPASAFSH